VHKAPPKERRARAQELCKFLYPYAGSSISAALRGAFSRSPCLFSFRTELSGAPVPLCLGFLELTSAESIAERKLRRRQLTEDGNVKISGRGLVGGSRRTLTEAAYSTFIKRGPAAR
jgi:hypothetical protein